MKKVKDGKSPIAEDEPADGKFPIVGVGASAGGLEAFLEFVSALPADTGMGFVLVSHLAPNHESLLTEILGRSAYIPVVEVKDEPEVLPNHIYVIPPDRSMTIRNGHLELTPRPKSRKPHHAVDYFFNSLASDRGHKSIGVVLSGTSNDGTVGLSDIKAAGGITFAQDFTAKFDGMPSSAIASGLVDFVLSPGDIAREIVDISKHPFVLPVSVPEAKQDANESHLGKVMDILHHAMGVDFTHYKKNTLHRRINRRMVLHKLESMADYAKLLRGNQPEVEALFQDILINVTSFFRNPDAFEALKRKVFTSLIEERAGQEPIRIWTLGCSTGEEAYSLAIALSEFVEDRPRPTRFQIFATDLNGAGIEKARGGLYSKASVEEVSEERLRRFFVKEDGSYRICKQIRDMCIFARHNVLTEPPFSRLDLITCRNMLIYLEPVMQQKVLPTLHYALRDRGFLWLGSSETTGSYRNLFETLDAKNKIYAKRPGFSKLSLDIAATPRKPGVPKLNALGPRSGPPSAPLDPSKEADRFLLSRYSPPGVVVNGDMEVLQFRGDTGAYLAPAAGRANFNLLKMLREGLLVPVRTAIMNAKKNRTPVREEGLRVKSNGGYKDLAVMVIPLSSDKEHEPSYLVLFEPLHAPSIIHNEGFGVRWADESALLSSIEPGDASRLRLELDATRDYLQSVIEQQEAANEQLQSANEEVQSANEELQSINEELETSKEEIQSSNEEMASVNDELYNRNAELGQTNNDLLNLLSSVNLPIVMLGSDLRIRRFTPMAERLLNLIPSDVGRKMSDLKVNLSGPDLEELVVEVIDSVTTKELEVQDREGRWFLLRIRPYKTSDNKIDGAVLILVDIDNIKQADVAIKESEERFRLLADAAPVLIWLQSEEGVEFANSAYLQYVGASTTEVRSLDWTRFIHPEDRAEYVKRFQTALKAGKPFEGHMRLLRADGEYRWMKTVGTPRYKDDGQFLGFVGASFDIHDLRDGLVFRDEESAR